MSQPSNSRLPLREVRRLADLTLNQGDGEWLPYEETWHEIATGLIRAVEALEEIADHEEDGYEYGDGWGVFKDVVLKAREALGA